MNEGDVIKIKGYLGFLNNPSMEVLEVKKTLVKLSPVNLDDSGMLGHLNSSWHSIEFIKEKLCQ